MLLFVLGLNHETAPLSVREKVAFPAESQTDALRRLVALPGVREAAVLSTCNRTEIYAVARDPASILDWMAELRCLEREPLQPHVYVHRQADAARHAFRVASGLDSMVLGETQILGQMKDAVELADRAGALGSTLHALFQRTFFAAKAVRSQTDIGAHSVSMAAASIRQSLRIFPDLRDLQILFIGAGEMIELCAAHYHTQRPAGLTVANRGRERGEAVAARFGGHFLPLEALPGELHRFDVVMSSTGSPLPILGKGVVERALKARRHRPMVMFDLAVPRDIEPEAGQLDDVYLYTVDDLAGLVQDGRERRAAEVVAAERIIDEQTLEFARWLDTRHVVPVIRGLRDQVERLKRHELERALKQLARGEPAEQVLAQFAQQLANKFLHHPTQALNQAPPEERQAITDLVSRLYNLDSSTD